MLNFRKKINAFSVLAVFSLGFFFVSIRSDAWNDTTGMRIPVKNTCNITNGPGEGMHVNASAEGIDFATSGDAVSAFYGKVIWARWVNGGFGNLVIVQRDLYGLQNFYSYYAHLSSISVSKDQYVNPGQTVGRIGKTGCSPCGTHLHFEVRSNPNTTNPAYTGNPVNVRNIPGITWNWENNEQCPVPGRGCINPSGVANPPERWSGYTYYNLQALERHYSGSAQDHMYTTWSHRGQQYNSSYINEGNPGWLADFNYHPSNFLPMYEYYSPGATDSFYTSNYNELGAGGAGYQYQGFLGYLSPTPYDGFTVPLFRYYSPSSSDHFYTTNWLELRRGNYGYSYEGIIGYVTN